MNTTPSKLSISICTYLMILTLISASCKKEIAPTPSNQDQNYLVNKDNPNDPVDHAIYQFYTSTKIPCFYNDTVVLKREDGSAGASQNFILLSLSYAPFEYYKTSVLLPKKRQPIPAILDLIKSEVIPKVPKEIFIPSILFVDTFWTPISRTGVVSADGWDSYHGFNTIAIQVRDIEAMNADEKKVYAASMLAGIVAQKLTNDAIQNSLLQNRFYSVSRAIALPLINDEIYYNSALAFSFPDGPPAPESLGFFHYIDVVFTINGMQRILINVFEEDDLRMFLAAAFTHSSQEFTEKYSSFPAIITKFNVIREIITALDIQLPD